MSAKNERTERTRLEVRAFPVDRAAYLDFDLLIEPAAGGYRARVLNSPAGQAVVRFTLPLEEMQGSREIFDMESAKAYGQTLFEAVFEGQVESCLRRSQDEASRQGVGLRIRLRLTEVPELVSLPWEYLYDPTVNRFPVLSTETPLMRYLDLPELVQPLAVKPPLSVLVMISSPADYIALDVEREWATLDEALGELEQKGRVTVERLEQASPIALQRQLRQGKYHVFHFIGHGVFDEDVQDGMVILEDEEGTSRLVSGQELGTLLHDHRSLRLAFLNACEGARASESEPFSGVAQSLIQQGIPAVVAMQFEISDGSAITLVREFYTAMAEGYPVDADLAEARKAVFGLGENVEWGTPVLYMRSPDGRVFDVDRTLPSSSEQVSEGLAALTDLMQAPDVHAAVVAFRTDFEAASRQIDVLGDYKRLHDLLHTMQFHCYHPIVQESRRFPDDEMGLDNLFDHELTFEGIVSDLQEVTGHESLASFDISWISELDGAHRELHDALENLEARQLKRAIWRMNRVLAIQPSQINTRLNEVARALRLPALLTALTNVRDHLVRFELESAKVRQFETGVDALAKLDRGLATLVEDHDRWQVIDLELRRIEAAMRQNTMELEMSWPDLKAMVEPMHSGVEEEWAGSLAADAQALDEAVAQEHPAKIRRFFWRYRRQAGDRFFRVDVDLKNLCEDLRDVGDPLTSVMKVLGQ